MVCRPRHDVKLPANFLNNQQSANMVDDRIGKEAVDIWNNPDKIVAKKNHWSQHHKLLTRVWCDLHFTNNVALGHMNMAGEYFVTITNGDSAVILRVMPYHRCIQVLYRKTGNNVIEYNFTMLGEKHEYVRRLFSLIREKLDGSTADVKDYLKRRFNEEYSDAFKS